MKTVPKTKNLSVIIHAISPKLRVRLVLVILIQLTAGLSEIFSITSFLPLLQAVMSDNNYSDHILLSYIATSTGQSGNSLLLLLATLFVFALCFSNFTRVVMRWMELRFIAAVGNELSNTAFCSILMQPYEKIISVNSSQIIGNMTNDLNETAAYLQSILLLVSNFIVLTSITIATFFISPLVACILVGILSVFYSGISAVLRRVLLRNGALISDSFTWRIRTLQEALGIVEQVKIDKAERFYIDGFSKYDWINRVKRANNAILVAIPRAVIECVCVIIAVTFIGYVNWTGGDMAESVSVLGVFALAGARLLPVVQQFFASYSGISQSAVPTQKLVSILESPSPDYHRDQPTSLTFERELKLENVGFSYASDRGGKSRSKQTLKDVTLNIKAKRFSVIVGPTGSGKSTLALLILGLLKPTTGRIYIDGTELTDQNLSSWQAIISYVPQSIVLTDQSIARNIATGIPEEQIDFARVKWCSETAQLGDFIESLPLGLETIVGDNGAEVSGGQRQRIGIARALYKNPSIIIMDEATSALDDETERSFMAAIRNLKSQVTVVMVAHRDGTISSADDVFRLEDSGIAKISRRKGAKK